MAAGADIDSMRWDIERLLGVARQRVHRAAVWAATPVAVERALYALAGLAAGYVLLRLVCLLTGQGMPIGWRGYGWLAGLAVVIAGAVTIGQAVRRRPSLAEAAERLDLGAGVHNRVAIGLELAARGDDSAFSMAAIVDGWQHLQRLADAEPLGALPRPRWRRIATGGALAGLLTIVAGLCPQATRMAAPGERALAAARPGVDRLPSGGAAPERPEARPSPAPVTGSATRRGEPSRPAQPAAASTSRSRSETAAGQTGPGGIGEARTSDQAASAAGESSGTSAASTPRRTDSAKSKKPKEASAPRPTDMPKPATPESSSNVSAGGAGGGALSPVQHDWSLRVQTAEGSQDQESTDEPVEGQKESNTQRGGVQPSLKDRREAPSRDLGPTGEEGPPGKGRGGPTPPKKSRGTASLVLGVPVPDFVKGRLGPGTTKITHERVQPSAMPGDPATPTSAAPRALPEGPIRRWDVPAGWAEIVRNYLVALHATDQIATAGGEPASAAEGASPRE